jgi:hypothetical protein
MKCQQSFQLLASMVVACAMTASAQASLLGTDSYVIGADPTAGQYVANTAIRSQPAALTNLGFVAGPYASGTGTSQFSATASGLNYAPLGEDSSSSGKVNYNAAGLDGAIRTNARNLSGVTPSSTYWISHLVNRGNIPQGAGTGYALTGFGNAIAPQSGATTGFLEGAYVGFDQDPTNPNNFGNLIIRSRRSAAQTAEDEVLIDGAAASTFGTTYAVVMKAEVDVIGGQDRISWWLNPTNFSNEATLTSSSLSSGSFLNFAYPADRVLDRLNYSAQNWNGNVFFDGVRLSSTLDGLGGTVPEPSSIALVVLAGLGLVAGRRFRLS